MRLMYFTAEFVSRRSILSAVISVSKCAHLSSSLASTDEVYLFTKGQVLGEGGILLEVGLLYFKYMFKMAHHYTKCVTTLFLSLCCSMMMHLLLTGTGESFRYFTLLPRNKFLMHSWTHAIMIPRIIPHA